MPFKFTLLCGKEKFKELLAKNNLKVILMVFTEGAVAPGEV